MSLPAPAQATRVATRCAIYTRKSADERADSQLSSIERQRELCEAYVASQAGEGWQLIAERYDDLGCSGGSLKRPSLQRLLALVDAGEVDTVVIYKIDRLTRSLRDFLALVDRMENRHVSLVAITQHFSTTSSMGRLTLNVLLSFAQFERDLTGERLRDWFAGARARGLWVNGPAPYGYRVEDLRLIAREDQAAVVRHAFRRYPAIGSARALAEELNARGYLNKSDRPFGKHVVTTMLRNRLYRGDLTHHGRAISGAHEALVTEEEWTKVQRAIADSSRRRAALVRPQVRGLLKGLIFGEHGGPLIHVFVHRPGGTYRYYIASVTRWQHEGSRYRADDIEEGVQAALQPLIGDQWPPSSDAAEGLIRRMVERIDLAGERMTLRLVTGAVISAPHMGLVQRRSRSLTTASSHTPPTPPPSRTPPPRTPARA